MTRPGIEPLSAGSLANTLPTKPIVKSKKKRKETKKENVSTFKHRLEKEWQKNKQTNKMHWPAKFIKSIKC